jgi:hypothetical protein
VEAEAKFDDESITVRNLEASYGLFNGQHRRFLLNSVTHFNLAGECHPLLCSASR